MNFQRTLKGTAVVEGVGLHSGAQVRVEIHPARPNHGITFVRKDIPGEPQVSAHYKNVQSTQMATTLGRGQAAIGTIEHLMAALQGLHIDNAQVFVWGPEVPVMDGSSRFFVSALEGAGIQTQLQPRAFARICRRVEVKVAEKWAVVEPSADLEIQASIDFDHPSIGYQEFKYSERNGSFSELADARTFGFLREVEALKKMGLARGGSLENAVVLDEGKVLNPDGLRHPDEFVRHKILDALGDFKLAGLPILGRFLLHRAGHDLHWKLLQSIFRDADNYEIIVHGSRDSRQPAQVQAAIARLVASI